MIISSYVRDYFDYQLWFKIYDRFKNIYFIILKKQFF